MCLFYCHNAHLISKSDNSLNLIIKGKRCEELVTFKKDSNIWITNSKNFIFGEKLKLLCPECKQELDTIAPCPCTGVFYAIYTTEKRSYSSCKAFCNSWGCKHSLNTTAWNAVKMFGERNFSII